MCVQAIKNIKKDEEILVNYGYSGHAAGPAWFRGVKRKHKEMMKLKAKENKSKRLPNSRSEGTKSQSD